MINSNSDALGIIFPNSYDSTVPELTRERSMASIPFAARYRLIDFILSNMVNGGIDNITVMVRENYLSLLDHLGSGREWDLTRKNGGLNTIPPFAYKNSKIYNGRIEALYNIKKFLSKAKEQYVIISDANVACNIDFKDMLATHIESGADITAAYMNIPLFKNLPESITNGQEMFYSLEIDKKERVKKIKINPEGSPSKKFNISMNVYIIAKEKLMSLIDEAYINGDTYFERDILARQVDSLDIRGYKYDGFALCFYSLQSYFESSMKLLHGDTLDKLFEGNPIYTKIRDDSPTRYIKGSSAKKVMAADGCVIEGEVENCILFRGVKIKKGAVVKNCILMQDTVVEENAQVEYVISDKNVIVGKDKKLSGSESFPVFVPKGHTV